MTQVAAERFDALYRRRYRDVSGYVRRRTDAEAADDVIAEVFVVAWRRLADVPAGNERAWLLATARRVLANSYRGDQRRAALAARVAATSTRTVVADPGEAVVERVGVASALAELAPLDQEVLRLAEWDQLSAAEIAIVLGCSATAAKVRLHRARRRFAAAYHRPKPTRSEAP